VGGSGSVIARFLRYRSAKVPAIGCAADQIERAAPMARFVAGLQVSRSLCRHFIAFV